MPAKYQNQLLRRQIDADFEMTNEKELHRRINSVLENSNSEIERLNNQIILLEAEVKKVSTAYSRRTFELEIERERRISADASSAYFRKFAVEMMEQNKAIEEKWLILSEIIKITLTPERYHDLRESIKLDRVDTA